jgi:hypothetical protein
VRPVDSRLSGDSFKSEDATYSHGPVIASQLIDRLSEAISELRLALASVGQETHNEGRQGADQGNT